MAEDTPTLKQSRITLNVGGHHFTTTLDTLTKYPETLLGRMFANDQKIAHEEMPFFDRSYILFDAIINFYRTDLLIKPELVAKEVWDAELGFWMLPVEESPQPDLKEEMLAMKGTIEKLEFTIEKIDIRTGVIIKGLGDFLDFFYHKENVEFDENGNPCIDRY